MSNQSQQISPRLLKPHLKNMKGKNVTIVGRLKSVIEKDRCLLLEVDHESKAEVKVKVGNEKDLAEFMGLRYLEVMGIVLPAEGEPVVELVQYTNFGESFDLKVYNEIVRISNQHFANLFTG